VFQLVDGVGPAWIESIYIPLIGNLDLFVLGMSLNAVVPWFSRVTARWRTLEAGLLLMAAFYLLATWAFTQSVFGIHGAVFLPWAWLAGPTVTGLCTAVIIVLLESHVLAAQAKPASPVARRLVHGTQLAGILTYAIYVWHEPIFIRQGSIFKGGETFWPSLSAAAVAIALTVLVAYFSYLMIEAPFERRKAAPRAAD
jgi:peptidoglycan/LPS O-acetylase OafA/YrhL